MGIAMANDGIAMTPHGFARAMSRIELVHAVAADMDVAIGKANEAVDAVLSAIEGGLRQGRDVRLAGFGTFAPSVRKATTGRNPRTGARIAVGATCSVRFRPGKALREAVSLRAGMGG